MAVTEKTYSSIKHLAFELDATTSGGLASQATTYAYDGEILGFCTIPSTSTIPTANYDLVLTDVNGVDLLKGLGANRSATATEYIPSSTQGGVTMLPANGTALTLSMSGATTGGVIDAYVWIR